VPSLSSQAKSYDVQYHRLGGIILLKMDINGEIEAGMDVNKRALHWMQYCAATREYRSLQ
jgi:hypothetical protein